MLADDCKVKMLELCHCSREETMETNEQQGKEEELVQEFFTTWNSRCAENGDSESSENLVFLGYWFAAETSAINPMGIDTGSMPKKEENPDGQFGTFKYKSHTRITMLPFTTMEHYNRMVELSKVRGGLRSYVAVESDRLLRVEFMQPGDEDSKMLQQLKSVMLLEVMQCYVKQTVEPALNGDVVESADLDHDVADEADTDAVLECTELPANFKFEPRELCDMTMHVQQACDRRFNKECIHVSSDPFVDSSRTGSVSSIEVRPLYDGRIGEALRINATPDAIRTRSPFTLCILAAAAGPLGILQEGTWDRVKFEATHVGHVNAMKNLIFYALHKVSGDISALEHFRLSMEKESKDRKLSDGHAFPHRDELTAYLDFVETVAGKSNSMGRFMSDQYIKSIPSGLKKVNRYKDFWRKADELLDDFVKDKLLPLLDSSEEKDRRTSVVKAFQNFMQQCGDKDSVERYAFVAGQVVAEIGGIC
jgi:hypothetical protein